MSNLFNTKKKILTFLLASFLLLSFSRTSLAATSQQLDDIKKKIEETQKLLDQTKQKKVTLQTEIAYQDNQIKLTTLKISETEAEIAALSSQINLLEVSLEDLSDVFAQRVVETYKVKRSADAVSLFLSSDSVSDFVSKYHYLQKIQKSDQETLVQLQTTQTNFEGQREKREELRLQMEKQKETLASQKAQKQNLLKVTQNDEKKFQQLLNTAKAELAAFQRFVASQGGASILNNQTKCDGWGCYYNQRDSSWGNMGIGNSNSSMANYGCLITSVAMISSHYNKNLKPSDIAGNAGAFFGDTAYLLHSFSVGGFSVSIQSVSASQLDQQLEQGRPVIAGLYSGPDHFIVIKGKDANGYIMNDPFTADGHDMPLTDKYKASDITSLRLVSFN